MLGANRGKSSLGILLVAAIVLSAAAFGLYSLQERGTSRSYRPEPLFDGIDQSAIAKVEIKGPLDTVTIEKNAEGGWGLAERDGYAIREDNFFRAINAILLLEPSGRMTQAPGNYDRLGVGDAAPSTAQVRLLGAGGEELANLYIGDIKVRAGAAPGGFAPPGDQVVRKAGDPWVYKIADPISIDATITGWLDKELINVENADLYRIQINNRGTTDSFTLGRLAEDDFTLQTDYPDGFKPTDWKVTAAARALAAVTLNDLMKRADDRFGEIDFATTYSAIAKNGLVYAIGAGKLGEKNYITIDAAYDRGFDLRIGDTRTSDSIAAEAMPDPVAAAEELNARHGEWTYEVSNFKFEDFTKKLPDLLEETIEEEDPALGPPVPTIPFTMPTPPPSSQPDDPRPAAPGEPQPRAAESPPGPGHA